MGEGQQAAKEEAAQSEQVKAANAEAAKNADEDAKTLTEDIKTFTFGNSKNTAPGVTLYYPEELKEEGKIAGKTSYVKFEFFEYKGPYESTSISGTETGTLEAYNASLYKSRRKPATDGGEGTLKPVVLYMPEDIQAQYGSQWGAKSIQNFTAGALRKTGATGGLDFLQFAKDVAKDLGGAADNIIIQGSKIALEAMQSVGQGEGLGINDILGTTRGIVLNPNTELLFAGFDLRTFTLNFKMVARSLEETDAIRSIITTFKKAMLPSLTKDTGSFGLGNAASFIKIPALVEVKFMAGSKENPYVTQFKPCAITGLNVNYTPDGSYAVYDNFAPVAITMQLSFSETKLVYKEEVNWGGTSY